MKRNIIVISLLLMASAFITTACAPENDMEKETPVENTEIPGDNNNGEENEMSRTINICVGEHCFTATLEDNATARAFCALLPMTLPMKELNGNEKYHYLTENLPIDSFRPSTIHSGDLMLYGANCIVLFYETFSSSYSYTRIGKIDNPSGLASVLGTGDANVRFEISNE